MVRKISLPENFNCLLIHNLSPPLSPKNPSLVWSRKYGQHFIKRPDKLVQICLEDGKNSSTKSSLISLSLITKHIIIKRKHHVRSCYWQPIYRVNSIQTIIIVKAQNFELSLVSEVTRKLGEKISYGKIGKQEPIFQDSAVCIPFYQTCKRKKRNRAMNQDSQFSHP